MIKRKKLLLLFIILSIINLLIYIQRDQFAYTPYATKVSLYKDCNQSCQNKWKQYINDYPGNDFIEAKKITDSLFHTNDSSTRNKIVQLSAFLYKKFSRQLGKPTDSLLQSSPLDQYKILCQNTSAQLWCGNFAIMYAYFCWAAAIPCRIIEIMNPGDHHVINECYLQDINQWVMVDITSNQLLTYQNNSLLSLLDFKSVLQNSLPIFISRVSADSLKTDSIIAKSNYLTTYYKKQNPLYYYYRINNDAVYRPYSKIYRYLIPDSWYNIYAENNTGNLLFYGKLFFLASWLFTGITLIIQFIKR